MHTLDNTELGRSDESVDRFSRTYTVTGMTCGHCVASVTEEVGNLAGVDSVDVTLVPGGESSVTVMGTALPDRDAVAAAIDEAGYALVAETP